MWVSLNGCVLNVFTLSTKHPCGESEIVTFASKGASVEFNMKLLSAGIEGYVSAAIIGVDGRCKAKNVKGASKSALSFASDSCDAGATWEAWRDWEKETFDEWPGLLMVAVRSYVNACHNLILSIIYEICATFSSVKNFRIPNDRTRPTCGASFLILLHRGACRRESARVRWIRRFQRLSLRSSVLDRLGVPR